MLFLAVCALIPLSLSCVWYIRVLIHCRSSKDTGGSWTSFWFSLYLTSGCSVYKPSIFTSCHEVHLLLAFPLVVLFCLSVSLSYVQYFCLCPIITLFHFITLFPISPAVFPLILFLPPHPPYLAVSPFTPSAPPSPHPSVDFFSTLLQNLIRRQSFQLKTDRHLFVVAEHFKDLI